MVAKKKTTRQERPKNSSTNTRSSSSKEETNDTMYVCLSEPTEKRKSILSSLKTSLILQEEHERILEIRQTKAKLVKDIKKDMDSLNSSYQELKRHLPNVKNVISYTEKELSVLEGNINMLRSDIESNESNIALEEDISDRLKEINSLKTSGHNKPHNSELEEHDPRKSNPQVGGSLNKNQKIKKPSSKDLSRLDRIKNNLKVIESKLNDI